MDELTSFKTTCEKHQIQQQESIENIRGILEDLQGRYNIQPLAHKTSTTLQASHMPAVQLSDIDHLRKQVAELSLKKANIRRQQSVINSLDFPHRAVRYNLVSEAHRDTFNWVFKEGSCGLLEWLKGGHGIFWVSGKPGSGKSTFMKFLANNSQTQQALNEWAAPRTAVLACHYFWHAGTTMERSQNGLLQDLILEIFCQRPDLIELVCPASRLEIEPSEIASHPWSRSDLCRT